MLTQEDNLLFQSYFTFVLLVELRKEDQFLKSQFFADMEFGDPWIKERLREIGIDNQGCALIALYVMLVIPREIIETRYKSEYEEIRIFLESHTQNTGPIYNSDKPKVDFLRHIRNAVAHSRISFRPGEVIIFEDFNNRNERFYSELPLPHLGELLQRLQGVHLKYYKDLQKQSR